MAGKILKRFLKAIQQPVRLHHAITGYKGPYLLEIGLCIECDVN